MTTEQIIENPDIMWVAITERDGVDYDTADYDDVIREAGDDNTELAHRLSALCRKAEEHVIDYLGEQGGGWQALEIYYFLVDTEAETILTKYKNKEEGFYE